MAMQMFWREHTSRLSARKNCDNINRKELIALFISSANGALMQFGYGTSRSRKYSFRVSLKCPNRQWRAKLENSNIALNENGQSEEKQDQKKRNTLQRFVEIFSLSIYVAANPCTRAGSKNNTKRPDRVGSRRKSNSDL